MNKNIERPKILLFGKNGQVGHELNRILPLLGDLVSFSAKECDFTQPEQIRSTIIREKPDWIINAAAYTAVDSAETSIDKSWKINAKAPELIAELALELDASLIHYSTDYVFDGLKSEPFTEIDLPNPLSEYGKSKLVGEKAIIDSGCRNFIFRTSWVFSQHGSNFLKTILRLAAQRESLSVVSDQFGAPTSAELLADVTAIVLKGLPNEFDHRLYSGVYHLSAAGYTSWFGYADFAVKLARDMGAPIKSSRITSILSSEYPTAAKRPQNSRLDTLKITERFNINLPDWQHHVTRTVHQLVEGGFFSNIRTG